MLAPDDMIQNPKSSIHYQKTPTMLAPGEVRMQRFEDELVARCRAGDVEAFGRVYAQYERQVFCYAYHLMQHREDADDIKQETFVRAYQSIAGFRGGCSLLTWLLKICGNLCRDRVRSWERRHVQCDDRIEHVVAAGDGWANDPHDLVERSETTETILCALHGLPAAQREILILHEIEGLSYTEIGAILDCSSVSAKLKLFRARRRLKERVSALLTAS